MLMNGKEVKHLVIGGETFDKSYVGKRVKVTPKSGYWYLHFCPAVNADGTLRDRGENYIVDSGDEFIILAKYMDCIFIANSEKPPESNKTNNANEGFGWVSINDVTLLD